MLGSVRRQRPWNWAAIGKHPVATDYIRVGDTSPLIEAMADWAAKGYQHLGLTKDQPRGFYSWRFWLQGIKKGEIICGLGRDSSDGIGRPFPLLLVGEGTIKGWEKQWTELPLVLGKTWKRMEFIVTRRFDNVAAMQAALHDLNSPGPTEHAWQTDTRDDACDFDTARFCDQMAGDGFGLVRLNHARHADPEQAVLQCHRRLGTQCRRMPRGVFVGGTPQQTYLAAVAHPLGKDDFKRLWTL